MKKFMPYALAVALCLPLFFRGMFFEKEQLVMYCMTYPLFLLFLWTVAKKEGGIAIGTLLDFAPLVLMAAYLLSLIAPISIRLAVSECLKYLNYLFIYYMVRTVCKERDTIPFLLNAIFAAIVAVSFVGIGAASKFISYNGAFSEAANELWINSSLQYHNAFAAIVLCGIVLGYGLFLQAERWSSGIWYQIGGFILVLGFIFSQSRGAWLVLPLAMVVFVVVNWRRMTEIVLYTVSISLPVIACANSFGSAIATRDGVGATLLFLFGLIVSAAVSPMIYWLISARIKRSDFFHSGAMAFSIMGGGIAILLLIVLFARTLLPATLVERLSNINFSEHSVAERFIFYTDAFKMIRVNPLLVGGGGGAWKVGYQLYQSYGYISNQAHSYFMQVWVEAGLFGIAGVIFMILAFLLLSLRAIKRDALLASTAACAALGLIIHSFFDFDFSLTSITIILWGLLAIVACLGGESFKIPIPRFVFVLGAAVGMVYVIMFMNGTSNADKGTIEMRNRSFTNAAMLYERAVSWDPLNADSKVSYCFALANVVGKDGVSKEPTKSMIEDMLTQAYALDSHNTTMLRKLQSYYSQVEETDKSIEIAERLIEVNPYNSENYDRLIGIYGQLTNEASAEGRNSDALEHIDKLLQVPLLAEKNSEGRRDPIIISDEAQKAIDMAKDAIVVLRNR